MRRQLTLAATPTVYSQCGLYVQPHTDGPQGPVCTRSLNITTERPPPPFSPPQPFSQINYFNAPQASVAFTTQAVCRDVAKLQKITVYTEMTCCTRARTTHFAWCTLGGRGGHKNQHPKPNSFSQACTGMNTSMGVFYLQASERWIFGSTLFSAGVTIQLI